MSNIRLHWVQLHVSALCISHHQVVLRLVEQLGVFWGVWEVVGRDLVPSAPKTPPPEYPAYCIVVLQV